MKLFYTYLQNIFGEGVLASEKYLKKKMLILRITVTTFDLIQMKL